MEKKKIDVATLRRAGAQGTGFLLHVGATILCPHGGQVSVNTTNTRVFVSGQPVVTQGDVYQVVGCPSGPCVSVEWLDTASRVFVNGKPVILDNSAGLCQSADRSPKGTPIVMVTQTRVKGS